MCHSHKKGRLLKNKLCHLTRKGPLLETDKDPNQNCRNRSQNASGSLELCHNMWHGFATRDSYRRGFCITPSVVKQCSKGYSNIFSYCPGDSTSSVQWVMIQDKPGRVLRSFVLDHSWTPFNNDRLNLLQYVNEHHCGTEVFNNHLSAAIQNPASDTSPL